MCDVAGGFSVFAGVGERTREGNDLYKEMTESVSCQLFHLATRLTSLILCNRHIYMLVSTTAGCDQAGGKGL